MVMLCRFYITVSLEIFDNQLRGLLLLIYNKFPNKGITPCKGTLHFLPQDYWISGRLWSISANNSVKSYWKVKMSSLLRECPLGLSSSPGALIGEFTVLVMYCWTRHLLIPFYQRIYVNHMQSCSYYKIYTSFATFRAYMSIYRQA